MSKEKNGDNPANVVLKKVDEKCFKILVIGNMYTGKTNLVRRYVHDQFLHDYKSTVGLLSNKLNTKNSIRTDPIDFIIVRSASTYFLKSLNGTHPP